jgi:hypothetical protein
MSVVQVIVAELEVTFVLVTFEITGGLFEGAGVVTVAGDEAADVFPAASYASTA